MHQNIILNQFLTSHYAPAIVPHGLSVNNYTCASAHPGIWR